MTTAKAGRLVLGALAALAAILGGKAAPAQTYPSRPIQVILPFAGGSASDVVLRILLERTAKSIGQPFIVDNRPGAGGNIGTAAGAKAAPDGYTLVMSAIGPLAANRALYRDLGSDPDKDFEPITLFAVFPNVIVVSSKLPVKSLAELIAYAKERPKQLTASGRRLFRAGGWHRADPRALPEHRAICARSDLGRGAARLSVSSQCQRAAPDRGGQGD